MIRSKDAQAVGFVNIYPLPLRSGEREGEGMKTGPWRRSTRGLSLKRQGSVYLTSIHDYNVCEVRLPSPANHLSFPPSFPSFPFFLCLPSSS
jgi:hypothetical protein